MSEPRVAAVVTCFDLGDFLPETLASLAAQTCREHELVVVDDGSTDLATLERLDELRAGGVRVLRTPNRGLSAARNLGIAATTAPVLCMVDADDILAPELFEKSLDVLDARPEVAFVSHWLRTFGEESREWRPESCELPAMVAANQVNGAALVRRSAVAAAGGFDERMRDGCEDWDLWLTLLELGHRGVILPEVLFHYRRRPGAMSAEMLRGDRFARTCRYVAEKHAGSFARYAGEAVAWREAETFHLLSHAEDLESEHLLWLRPEVERWRDDVATLERAGREAAARREAAAALEHAAARSAELERRAAETAAALAAERESGADLARRLAETESGLAAARETGAALERQVAQAATELTAAREGAAALERRLAEGAAELAASRASGAELERRLATASAELAAEAERCMALERRAAALASEVAAGARRGAELEERIRDLAAERAVLAAELGGARAHAAELDRERLALGERLREIGDRLGHLDHAERHWRGAFEAARDEALRWHAESSRLAAEVAAVRSSLSWRLTSPLRRLASWAGWGR